jgi:hypothetical protein
MHAFDGFGALAVERSPGLPAPGPQALEMLARANAARSAAEATPHPAAEAKTGTAKTEEPARPVITATTTAESIENDGLAGSRPARRSLMIAACVLLLLFFLGQLTYLFRGDIAARYPGMKTALVNVCRASGCTVSLPQRPDLIKIEASDVNMIDPGRPALIQLTATLRSYADYDVAYPALDLVLTNATEHALARRIFVPEEYLDGTRDPQIGLPARGEITVALDLDTGNLNAAGFRLDLLAAH